MRGDGWRRSSFCGSHGACVEVWDTGAGVYVRDSRHPDGWLLHFGTVEWKAFTEGVRAGEFDLSEKP